MRQSPLVWMVLEGGVGDTPRPLRSPARGGPSARGGWEGGWPVQGDGHSWQLWSQVASEGVGAEAVRVDVEGSRVS